MNQTPLEDQVQDAPSMLSPRTPPARLTPEEQALVERRLSKAAPPSVVTVWPATAMMNSVFWSLIVVSKETKPRPLLSRSFTS